MRYQCKRLASSKRVVQPTAPSAVPLRQILQPAFPLPLRESFKQWTHRTKLREAEEALFGCVGLRPNAAEEPFSVRSIDVPVHLIPNAIHRQHKLEGSITMNELEVRRNNYSGPERHAVVVHGYGASKGYFYKNIKSLASTHTVHALDWLGYGLSSRPTPKLPRFPRLRDGISYGEEWFLKPFESWRRRRGLTKFTIVAHSLGAYLACAYASANPEQVEKLVLVSPASVNRTGASIPGEELYADLDAASRGQAVSPMTANAPQVPVWFKHLWERHLSPFSLVRNLGPWGPKLTSGWTSRRFAELSQPEQLALQDYSYRMFNAKGSGEYLLNYFLACGGVGRWPLAERLQKIRCPSLWLYGDRDWMDFKGGEEAVRRLRASGNTAELLKIRNSGHHLYLDNQLSFDQAVQQFIA